MRTPDSQGFVQWQRVRIESADEPNQLGNWWMTSQTGYEVIHMLAWFDLR